MDKFRTDFYSIVNKSINRDGIQKLLEWVETTDFFIAPASTRYHGCWEGGLVQHSLNVYTMLNLLNNWFEADYSSESIAIVALFHDFCKIGCYKTELRWRKDRNDRWEQYPTYKHDEDFAYGGHGAKSVYLIQSFIRLTPDEAAAINCHMGQWDATTYSNPSTVYERNTLAWLLHVADEAATYLLDKKQEV